MSIIRSYHGYRNANLDVALLSTFPLNSSVLWL